MYIISGKVKCFLFVMVLVPCHTTYSTGLTHLDVYNVSNGRQIWTYNLKLFNDKLTIKTMYMNKFILLIIVFLVLLIIVFLI